MTKENVHLGHRDRMKERLLNFPDSLQDYELLEIALYRSLPRIDTNSIAHSLLNNFGSLEKVFSAPKEELMIVDGVGEKTAGDVILLGKLLNQIIKERQKNKKSAPIINSVYSAKENLREYFNNLKEEHVVVWLLDKKFTRIYELFYSDRKEGSVTLDVKEIARAIAIKEPSYLIVAHNHVGSDANPSKADDESTEELNIICKLHKVKFADHIIFAGKDEYSYSLNERIIKE